MRSRAPYARAACLVFLVSASSALHAQDAKKPAPASEDDEFLEFLGSVDSDANDDDWLEFLAQTDIATVAKAKTTPPAPGKKPEGKK